MSKNKLINFHNKYISVGNMRVLYLVSAILALTLNITLVACRADIFGNKPTITPELIPVDLQDRSWLTGDPCSPPCWYGLDLDVSTEEEIIAVLESLPFVDTTDVEKSIIGYGDALTEEHYNATLLQAKKINNINIRIKVGKGVLKQIDFGLNYKITIGEVVEQTGVPDVVRILPDFNTNFCYVEFYWLEKQLVISSRISGADWKEKCMSIEDGNTINRNSSITHVRLIYQNWLTAMMDREEAVPWPGFSE